MVWALVFVGFVFWPWFLRPNLLSSLFWLVWCCSFGFIIGFIFEWALFVLFRASSVLVWTPLLWCPCFVSSYRSFYLFLLRRLGVCFCMFCFFWGAAVVCGLALHGFSWLGLLFVGLGLWYLCFCRSTTLFLAMFNYSYTNITNRLFFSFPFLFASPTPWRKPDSCIHSKHLTDLPSTVSLDLTYVLCETVLADNCISMFHCLTLIEPYKGNSPVVIKSRQYVGNSCLSAHRLLPRQLFSNTCFLLNSKYDAIWI